MRPRKLRIATTVWHTERSAVPTRNPADKTIKLWRISTGACFHTIPSDPLGKVSHSDEVLAIAIAPDQSILATGSADNSIRTWKVIGL